MNGISVQDLIGSYDSYIEGWTAVQKLVEQGRLIPIKSSGSNGMKPPLYQRYRRPSSRKDRSELRSALEQELFPPLSIAYYRNHLAQYEKDRQMVLDLQNWLINRSGMPDPVSVNERSFEIFHQEKVLARHGRRLMDNLKLSWDDLAVYETCEPVSSYSASRKPGPILIVENLDPFVTIRRLLMNGQKTICGLPVSTVVYGSGKSIIKTFRDLLDFGPPEVLGSLDQVYYWGDLDWEGILIYEALCRRWPDQTFHLFVNGYQAMLEKAAGVDSLPITKEGQREIEQTDFFELFSHETAAQMRDLLNRKVYIPQEILNAEDYRKENHDG